MTQALDLQTYIQNQMKVDRQERLSNSDQFTLGEIILKLESIIIDEEEPNVIYDFCGLYPTDIDSWRGSYAELALNFGDEEKQPMKLSEFLHMLKSTIGKIFEGYKGGEYTMSRHTPVWVDNWGRSTETAIVDVVSNGCQVILITGIREF